MHVSVAKEEFVCHNCSQKAAQNSRSSKASGTYFVEAESGIRNPVTLYHIFALHARWSLVRRGSEFYAMLWETESPY